MMKLWMFEHWLEDHRDDAELIKNHGYLVGSFINPEAVKQLTGAGSTSHKLSDEEFEESYKLILQDKNKDIDSKQRRRRKIK